MKDSSSIFIMRSIYVYNNNNNSNNNYNDMPSNTNHKFHNTLAASYLVVAIEH